MSKKVPKKSSEGLIEIHKNCGGLLSREFELDDYWKGKVYPYMGPPPGEWQSYCMKCRKKIESDNEVRKIPRSNL